MNDSEKKILIKKNESYADYMEYAEDYVKSCTNPSQEEFAEMVSLTDPSISTKAAKGFFKVAYFKVKGKQY